MEYLSFVSMFEHYSALFQIEWSIEVNPSSGYSSLVSRSIEVIHLVDTVPWYPGV